MDLDQLTALASQYLTEPDLSAVLSQARPSVRLLRAGPDQTPGVILAGEPVLPDDFDWPFWDGAPLDCLAEVDMAAVHRVYPEAPLPESGRLVFFALSQLFNQHGELLGARQTDTRPGWRVLFVPDGVAVTARRKPDVTVEGVYPQPLKRVECVLALEPTVPNWWSYDLPLRDKQTAATFYEALSERGPLHRIGGWADPTQHQPAHPVALADTGLLNTSRNVDFQHPQAQGVLQTANDDWFLLLQLDTDDGDDGAGWMWGDAGVMFFYVRPDASRIGDFTRAWMNWDCT